MNKSACLHTLSGCATSPTFAAHRIILFKNRTAEGDSDRSDKGQKAGEGEREGRREGRRDGGPEWHD